jgi:hypothetical protein
MVHEEGLEVEKIEASFWESVQWVLFTLLYLLSVVCGFFRLDNGDGFGSDFLLFDLDSGLESFGAGLDHTINLHDGLELADALKPGSSFWGSLAEATIEQGLEEGNHKETDT